MDEIFRQLGELALGSIPTIILFLLLYLVYLLLVHKPLARVLAARQSKTTGAVQKAKADIAAAEEKTAEYEHRIRDARVAIYKTQEGRRQQIIEARIKAVAEVRATAQAKVQTAKAELEKDKTETKARLQSEAASLASEIIRIILGRRVEERTPVGGR